jgi:hypothetical protein
MSISSATESGKVDARERGDVSGESLGELAAGISAFVQQAGANGTGLREFERGLFDRLLKIGHAATEQFLALQGDGDRGAITTDGAGQPLHRSAEPVDRPLRTVFGKHTLRAYVYRRRAHPHTPIVLRPVDERLGITPDQWSPLVQEFTLLFSVEQAFDQAAATFETIFRQRLSVDTLERVCRRNGAAAGEFLDSLASPPADEEGELLVLTADGKGVPLVTADAAKVKSFEDRPQRPGNRRMATLAAVYSVDRYVRTPEEIVEALFREERERPPQTTPRPKPRHKRVVARLPQVLEDIDAEEPISGALLALSWASREVAQRRRPDQTVIRLLDGQHSLWETAALCCDVPAESVVEVLDVLHVAGYVWRAAKAFYPHREHQEAFARDRLLRILQGDAKGVVSGLRRMATQRGLSAAARKEIDAVCGYLEAHLDRMQYHSYLAAGYPIATGVIEGACRHLVKDRLERSGMRWTLEGAQAMLNLRALRQSSYWDEFHSQHASPHAAAETLTG